ncbi:hypothetical protein GVX82_01605 [Patescibacteria group bacterium]|jgi:type IV pilus assembly protein PilC|nr:hypothetical protein [Patescibacteria group bacterium]
MRFTYTAKDADGTTYTKSIEAENRFEVYGLVRKEGATILSVKEAAGGLNLGGLENMTLRSLFARISMMEKILFARNLGAMITAGLTVTRAIEVMLRQSKNPKFKEVLTALNEDISQGGDLHSAMQKHPKVFSTLMVSMVRAGEESGKLAEALKQISVQMEKVYELKKRIKGAMIYPGIIVTALLIIGALMMIFIVPTLRDTFEAMEVELPATTQFVIGLSAFLTDYTLLALLSMIALVTGFVYGLRTKRGSDLFDTVVLKIPMIGGIVREANAATTARTLASLLSSGVQVLAAFEITEEVIQNHHFKAVVRQARDSVQKGIEVSDVFRQHEHLYPPLVGEMIAVGEETGKLPDLLDELAKYYEREVEQKTANISTFIEPFLMLVVGAAVGFFAVSMLSPIYSITSSMQ